MELTAKIIFGVLYTLVFIILAIDSTGAGHGTFIFFAPIPTWILILIALGLTTKLENTVVRIIIPVLLIVHYLTTTIMIVEYLIGGSDDFIRRWEMSPYLVLFIFIWYVIGQAIVWTIYFLEMRRINRMI